jgi:hypothetical protein
MHKKQGKKGMKFLSFNLDFQNVLKHNSILKVVNTNCSHASPSYWATNRKLLSNLLTPLLAIE